MKVRENVINVYEPLDFPHTVVSGVRGWRNHPRRSRALGTQSYKPGFVKLSSLYTLARTKT